MNETLRAMWQTRPFRLPSSQGSQAPGAGVCEGIGIRYQIDPTIIRILFVCSVFFGVGFVAYLMCWLFMPRYSVPLSPAEAIFTKAQDPRYAKDRETGWILGVIITVSVLALGAFTRTFAFALLVGFLIWWILHSKQPSPPQVALPAAVPVDGFAGATSDSPLFGRTQPPAWDPLGTAPFAWDLPDPPPAAVAAPPKRRRVWPWFIITGVVMAPLLGILSIGWVSSSGLHDGLGSQRYTISNPESLQDNYSMDVGELHLDLSNLGELPEDTWVDVSMTTGEILIDLPDKVPVTLTCTTSFGDAHCNSGSHNKGAQGGTLNLNVHNDVGTIKVQ